MIVVYPMLVSRAVSENIVPGLAKTVEGYIIVNAKDSIITDTEVKRKYNFKIKAGKMITKESVDLLEGTEEEWGGRTKKEKDKAKEWKSAEELRDEKNEREKDKATRDEEKHAKDMIDKQRKREKEDKDEIKEKEIEDAKKASVSVKISDNKALSIEPSTIDIEVIDKYGNKRTESFGVKVIPFRVKSDAKLSRLILHDIQMKSFNATMVGFGRKITRIVWKFLDRWSGNLKLGGITPSGDPRRDIIMARTGHGGEGFIVLSKTEDIDEVFLTNIKRINRLFKMGWGNIIITDDINRMAYFCMKKFRGVCTAISYSMIYANFGQLQVYNDLEDAKRKTSSIFKIRKQFSKIVAEWVVDQKQSKYLSEGK